MKKLFFFILLLSFVSLFAKNAFIEKVINHYKNFENEMNTLFINENMTISQDGQQMKMNIEIYKKADKSRVNITMISDLFPELKSTVINDGNEAYLISSVAGKQKLTEEEKTQYEFVKDFFWWSAISSDDEDFKIIGEEKIDGENCKILEYNYPKDQAMEYEKIWITTKDYKLMRAESKSSEDMVVITMSDYHAITDNYQIAYDMKIYTDGELITSVKIDSFAINTKLDDKIFNVDNVDIKQSEELKNLLNQYNNQ